MRAPIPSPEELLDEQADAFEELMAEMYPIYRVGCDTPGCMCKNQPGILVTQLN